MRNSWLLLSTFHPLKGGCNFLIHAHSLDAYIWHSQQQPAIAKSSNMVQIMFNITFSMFCVVLGLALGNTVPFLVFLRNGLWLFNFRVSSSTSSLMVGPPGIMCRGCSVHCTFHIAKVRLSILAGSITPPPVFPVLIYFIVKTVINLKNRD